MDRTCDITTALEDHPGSIFNLNKSLVVKLEASSRHTLRMDFSVKLKTTCVRQYSEMKYICIFIDIGILMMGRWMMFKGFYGDNYTFLWTTDRHRCSKHVMCYISLHIFDYSKQHKNKVLHTYHVNMFT